MTEIEKKFQEWLKENNVFISVAVRTPQGEYVKPENFILPGWAVVIGVTQNVQTQSEKSTSNQL